MDGYEEMQIRRPCNPNGCNSDLSHLVIVSFLHFLTYHNDKINEIKTYELNCTKRLIDWCIFILLSRESDGALCFGRIRTRLGVDHFTSFPVDVLTSSHVNLLLVQSHQAEIIIVKRLIQGRNNVTRVRVEVMILRSESS